MHKYNTHLLFSAIGYITLTISDWRLCAQLQHAGQIKPYTIPLDQKAMFIKSIERLRDSATELRMSAAARTGRDAYDFYLKELTPQAAMTAHGMDNLLPPADRFLHTYVAESESRQFYVLSSKHAQFFSETDSLFGPEVDRAFPSAAAEIRDAGKCRAAGLWTATVLHLMRALEPAINALAAHFGVARDLNWNRSLDQIDAKLKDIKRSSYGEDQEQWASEASAHLRAIKKCLAQSCRTRQSSLWRGGGCRHLRQRPSSHAVLSQ